MNPSLKNSTSCLQEKIVSMLSTYKHYEYMNLLCDKKVIKWWPTWFFLNGIIVNKSEILLMSLEAKQQQQQQKKNRNNQYDKINT